MIDILNVFSLTYVYKMIKIINILLMATFLISCGKYDNNDEFKVKTGTIINGVKTSNKESPWQVAMIARRRHFLCGGSLISKRLVLTAAHCVINLSKSDFSIYGGSQTGQISDLVEFSSVKNITIHHLYDFDKKLNDLALIELTGPVTESEYVKAIKLPTEKSLALIDQMEVTGWGKTGTFHPTSKQLLKLGVRLATKDNTGHIEDSSIWSRDFYNEDGHISVIGSGDNIGNVCHGDSGGPMYFYDGLNPVIVGVASFVIGGKLPDLCYGMSVYTDVRAHLQWINYQIRSADYSAL